MQVAIVTLVLLGAALVYEVEGLRYRPKKPYGRGGHPEPEPEGCSEVMCMMYCPNGFELDANGCSICKCKNKKPGSVPEPEVEPEGDHACALPKVVGRCRSKKERWYFDSSKKQCTKFYYGGCGGNENNFNSESACEKYCEKNGKKPEDSCPKGQSRVHCYVDPCTARNCPIYPGAKCKANYCGGCKAEFYLGEKNVTTQCLDSKPGLAEPEGLPEECQQPKMTGRCRAMFRNWYYNTASRKCEQFVYGGCGGNDNNFKNQKACERKCGSMPHSPPSPVYPASPPSPVYPAIPITEVAMGASVSKFDSVRKLAELAEQKGILHPTAPRNVTQEAHRGYSDNMKVCLCY